MKNFPRLRPGVDPPFAAAELCAFLNASHSTCEAAFAFTPNVDTLCLVDFEGTGSTERLENLAALDANIVVNGFLIRGRDAGALAEHLVKVDVRHPRLRIISAATTEALVTAIDELAVAQAGWTHCRMTILTRGDGEPPVDKNRVVGALSALYRTPTRCLLI